MSNRTPMVSLAIVTHNRPQLLTELLISISKLTFPIQSVVIVDNCSSEATQLCIANWSKESPIRVISRRLPENTGGAGGFHQALKICLSETTSDWFWLLDDDVTIEPNALEKLLFYAEYGKCIHGVRYGPDNLPVPFEQVLNPATGFTKVMNERSFLEGKPWCEVNVGCFEGMLIHREIVNKIGLPDPHFFIYDDDTWYGFQASQHTKVLYVNDLVLRRQLTRTPKKNCLNRLYYELSDDALYYSIRNKFLLHSLLKKAGYSNSILFSLRMLRFIIRLILFEVFGSTHKSRRMHMIQLAIIDGLHGRAGVRTSPQT